MEFSHLNLKPPTTFEEQIAVMRSRGLLISNECYANQVLQCISYFRLSSYFFTEKRNDEFHSGTTFEKIARIYEFDAKLRNFLLSLIEPIEIAFRTQIAYLIAHKYGNTGHLYSEHFERHGIFLSALEKEMNRSSEVYISHHKKMSEGITPVWVALEIIPLSVLSRLYSNMKIPDQNEIAEQYYNVASVYVRSWLKCLNDLRNICAHHGRIYNRRLPSKPKLFKNYIESMVRPEYVFAHLIAYKYLYLDKVDWDAKMTQIDALIEGYSDTIQLRYLGFPANWIDFLRTSC